MSHQAKMSERSKKAIQEIAQATGESQIDIIEHAVLSYQREWRMQKINEAYAKLKGDSSAWAEELEERSFWEKMNEDGLYLE